MNELEHAVKWAGVPQIVAIIIFGTIGILAMGWPLWAWIFV